MPKVYCKYCYKHVGLEIGPDGSVWVCDNCGAGLCPMGDAENRLYDGHATYRKFRQCIDIAFSVHMEAIDHFNASMMDRKYYPPCPHNSDMVKYESRKLYGKELIEYMRKKVGLVPQ